MSKSAGTSRPQVALPTPSELLGLGTCPANLIAHSAWNEARERVMALVDAGPALIALLGPPGTGKTALLRHLAASFRERGRTVCLLYSGDRLVDVGLAEIVLVDEADRISDAQLEAYRSRSSVAVVFAALPASRKRFETYAGMSVVRLPRLSPEQACKFVAARLAQLGLPKACLTEAAWAQLIAHGRGAPRLLLGILGLALFLAGEEHAACVTGPHVEEAVEARGGSPEAIAAEPTAEEAAAVGGCLPAVVSRTECRPTDTGPGLAGGPPPARRMPPRVVEGLYLALVVALYAVPAAAWLTWSMHRNMVRPAAADLEAPARTAAAMAKPSSDELPPATAFAPAEHVGVLPSPPRGSISYEAPGSSSDRGAASAGAPGTGQPRASERIAESSDLDAKIEHRTPAATAAVPELHQVQSQAKEGSDRSGQANWHGARVQVQAAENPYSDTDVPVVSHQALAPRPLPRAAFLQRPTMVHMSLPVRQLLSARRALLKSNSSAARGLLEAAQTTIVFEAGIAPGRSGIAVGQITNALSLLNSGSTMRALTYLDRAIVALQPTS